MGLKKNVRMIVDGVDVVMIAGTGKLTSGGISIDIVPDSAVFLSDEAPNEKRLRQVIDGVRKAEEN